MKKRTYVALSAIALSAAGAVLGAASPATAMPASGGIPYFDGAGNYMGCESSYTGAWYTPAEMTYAGCISDWEN